MPLTAGSRLKRLRQLAKLSQYELAGRAAIGRDKVSRFECDYSTPSPGEWRRLEDAIDEAVREQQSRLAKLCERERSRKNAVQESEITA